MPPKQYKYGEDVIINGRNVGQARFDTATGRALTPETVPASVGGFRVDATRTGVSQPQAQQQVQPIQQQQNTQQNTMVDTPVGELFSYTPRQSSNPELDQFYSQYRQDATQAIDEDAIKQQKLQQVQSNIDALRQVYAQKLRETQRQGQNRLGQSSAIQARSGMLGSDFGAAQTSEVGQFNADIENSVRMEEQAAIEALKAQAEDRASQAIREKRAAKEAGAEKYIEYLKTTTQRKEEGKRNLVQDLLLKGIDPRKLDSGSLQSILNGYGITQDALFSMFDTEKIKGDQASAQAQTEAEAKARRENIELGKIEMETKLMRDKFEEDKRRFGLEYAIKQQDLGLKRQALNQKNTNTPSNDPVSNEAQKWVDQFNSGALSLQDVYKILGSSKEALPIKEEVARLVAAQGGNRVLSLDDAQIEAIDSQIKNIDDLIKGGQYKVITGPIQGGALGFGARITGRKDDVLAIAKNLVSNQTLQSLAEAKAKGITFGALSGTELSTVADAASRIAAKIDRDPDTQEIIGFKGTEAAFKADLQKIREGLEKGKMSKTNTQQQQNQSTNQTQQSQPQQMQLPNGQIVTLQPDGTYQ